MTLANVNDKQNKNNTTKNTKK